MLHRLPIKDNQNDTIICNLCRTFENIMHIFFNCIFAKEVWNMFGVNFNNSFSHFDILNGFIKGVKKDSNLFWAIFSCEILWIIWKFMNEAKFQNRDRMLTESLRRLICYDVDVQVTLVMRFASKKFERFIEEGYVQVYLSELSYGYT